jgi:hypothetical protein
MRQRRLRGWASRRSHLAKAHDTLIVDDPQHGQPPVIGSIDRLGHAGAEPAVTDPDLLLLDERRTGVCETFGHRPGAYRASSGRRVRG